MGVDFYIVNHANKTKFGLSRCYILHEDYYWLCDKDFLLSKIVEGLSWNENFCAGYCVWLRDKIWEFIKDVQDEKDIDILTDGQVFDLEMQGPTPDFHYKYPDPYPNPYEQVGDRYAKKEVWLKHCEENY